MAFDLLEMIVVLEIITNILELYFSNTFHISHQRTSVDSIMTSAVFWVDISETV